MADLDPATMDALNQLGEQIEAENGAAAPETPADGDKANPQPNKAEPREAAAEAPEAEETAVKNEAEPERAEGEEQPAEKPKPAPRKGVEKDVQRLLRERYEARNKAAEAEARAAEFQRRLAELEAKQAQQTPATTEQRPGQSPAQQPPVVQQRGENTADFEARVQAEAARRADAAAWQAKMFDFNQKGVEQFADFNEVCNSIAASFGRQVAQHPEFMQAASRLDNGQAVLHHLGNNLEELETLFNNEPVGVIMAMKDLSVKLKAPKTPQRQSNAPAPVNPIRGGSSNRGGGVRLDDDKADIGDWSKQFLKELSSL